MLFFQNQIEKHSSKYTEDDILKISKIFEKYMNIVQEYIANDLELSKNANIHLRSISNYSTRRYLKYNVFHKVYEKNNEEFSKLSSKIKSTSKFPPIIEHYVWKKAISELMNIDKISHEEKSNNSSKNLTDFSAIDEFLEIEPININVIEEKKEDFIYSLSLLNKCRALNKWFSTISKAFLLLVEDSNEVTADDLLQFAAFVFVLSDVKTLVSSIQYIKNMNWTPNPEEMGEYQYVLTTTQSSLEYLKTRFKDLIDM